MGILYENRINELLLWRRSTLAFLPHFHDSLEIIYIMRGSIRAIIGGKEYPMEAGSLSVALPNDIHGFDNETDIDAYSLIIPRRYLEPYAGILDTNTVSTAVVQLPEILPLIEKIFYVNKTPHPFRKQMLKGYFSILFGEIFAKTGLCENKKSTPETERRIISYCSEHFREDISLALLAQKLSLPDFLGSLRVAEARRLIEEGTSMTNAAFEAGFTSIRTFNRRFYAETGMSPREYAKSKAL